jgi:hypothetical protein
MLFFLQQQLLANDLQEHLKKKQPHQAVVAGHLLQPRYSRLTANAVC